MSWQHTLNNTINNLSKQDRKLIFSRQTSEGCSKKVCLPICINSDWIIDNSDFSVLALKFSVVLWLWAWVMLNYTKYKQWKIFVYKKNLYFVWLLILGKPALRNLNLGKVQSCQALKKWLCLSSMNHIMQSKFEQGDIKKLPLTNRDILRLKNIFH